jgi:hypothetical protein
LRAIFAAIARSSARHSLATRGLVVPGAAGGALEEPEQRDLEVLEDERVAGVGATSAAPRP